jgi:gliding motility associated protien GldN
MKPYNNWIGTLGMILLGTISLVAQQDVLNAKTPQEMRALEIASTQSKVKPMSYGYVDQRDILWSKTVWEVIDLDERINFPLYYPVDTVSLDITRRSLYDVLVKNIKNGTIKEVYVDSYFTEKRAFEDLKATLQKVDTTDMGFQALNAGEVVPEEYINRRDITAADIEQYLIKGMWYFDKRLGELKYRLLGIAPVAPDVNFIDDDRVDPEENKVPLFWVWYPSVRDVLHKAQVFNQSNPSNPISFDMLLNARRFNSMIYREDNEFGDRDIKDYIVKNALFQLIESNRIKEAIRDKEQDMWSY